MGVAENIKQRRLELGLSQQELADMLGYKSRSTITKIESNENSVPAAKLYRFAKALDTTVEFLKTGNMPFVPREVAKTKDKKRIAVILAGGKSTRNLQNIPNQFINVLGKPVIMYVLDAYQRHPAIDQIYIVCLKNWEDIVLAYANQYEITKLNGIIPAGETGILSVRNAVDYLKGICSGNDTVILQESTRPLVTEEIISKLLHCERNAIICEAMDGYVQMLVEDDKKSYIDREKLMSLQSPEAYDFDTLQEAFLNADLKNYSFSDTTCAMMMYRLGYDFTLCEGNHNNIKVVRQEDISVLCALLKNEVW